MEGANEITDDVVWTALNALVLTSSNPDVEVAYTVLLYHLASDDHIDISKLESALCAVPVEEEFRKLLNKLKQSLIFGL